MANWRGPVHGEQSCCTLSRRIFGLNLGVKVGAMPKHSDCFCNNESVQKAKTWGYMNLAPHALGKAFRNERNMIQKILSAIITAIILLLTTSVIAQPTVESGKALFRNYCATCHAKDMKTDLTGPALNGAEERWSEYPREDLYSWVRNSQAVIASGHPRAKELWDEWRPTVMTSWPNLTDEDIESIFLYVNEAANPVNIVADGGPQGEIKESSDTLLYYGLFALLALLAMMLSRFIGSLNEIAAAKEGLEYERKTFWQNLTSKKMVSFLIFLFVLIAGYTTVSRAINLGRQQTYAPDQPIKFSHETHAGINKINCQYCHDGARRSKHSIIPSTQTCMNCHKAITVGSQYGTQEISKIYASIGYNPNEAKYIENYDEMEDEDIKTIFKKWFATNYIADEGKEAFIKRGEEVISEQWDNIVTSLTNDQKKSVKGPIEWTRIHNLPDYVYFSHAQHVTVGELECQTCHGKVEEMEVVSQHSPLSMGWCINCHRETEVQFTDNEYYTSYIKYHEELGSGEREMVTVEDIGGLECQKCHY